MMLVKRLAMTVFVVLALAFFACMVVAMNVVTALLDSFDLVWDVGSRVLGGAWDAGEGEAGA